MRHRHTKKCRHTKRLGGRTRKHHHTKRCRHSVRMHKRMKGGNSSSYPSSYPLGVKQPVSDFDFNAASYGSSTIPTSNPVSFPYGDASMSGESISDASISDASISNASISNASMTGGRRYRSRRHHSRRHHSRRKHRGGMGYSFLPPGSDVSAKDSYLANVAPYSVYNE